MKVDPLFVILLLAGTEPLHETRQQSFWKKINKVGFFLCIAQNIFTVLGFFYERDRPAAITTYNNNVQQISIQYKQFFTITQPFVYLVGKVLHLRFTELFHLSLTRFDDSLRSGTQKYGLNFNIAVKRTHEITMRLNTIASLILVVGEIINIWIGVIYVKRTTFGTPHFRIFYFYQVTVVNFVASAFYIGIKLNDIKMRLQLLVQLEKEIVKEIQSVESERNQIFVLK